ncbi:MAG: hypothetical protein AB7F89_07280 [Pirellulaceae bacterium]
MPSEFDQLEQVATQGVDAILARLTDQLRQEHKYHELFEVLKIQVRRRLQLPLLSGDASDNLDEARRHQLEEGLLSACREVGMLLIGQGKIREAWMYLRPVGERAEAARALATIKATDENTDELVEVCLHEGVDIGRGFQLVLDKFGTCNAITTYESSIARQSRSDQQAAAEQLVRHVHGELLRSVTADIARQENATPAETTLRELVADRDWLFGEYSYHIDTTHLASTVRIARVVDAPDVLVLARDMTEYGRRLAQQFQYKGEEPFADIYPSHALFFDAVLGHDVTAALRYFGQKAETLDAAEHGSLPVETYVQLLDRVGQYTQAMDVLMRFADQEQRPRQVVPLLMDLAGKQGDYTSVAEFCRRHHDLLGFGSALAHQQLLASP